MRGRLFERNPAAWLLALFDRYRAPHPGRIDTRPSVEYDDIVGADVDELSGPAETSGLP